MLDVIIDSTEKKNIYLHQEKFLPKLPPLKNYNFAFSI